MSHGEAAASDDRDSEINYFYEDVVYRLSKRAGGGLEFGMVVENSEFAPSDEEDEDEGYEHQQRLKVGHVRVAWHPKGNESVVRERRVRLADRSLMPGDVVRRMISGKETQRGYCRDVKVVGCLHFCDAFGEGKVVVRDVPSDRLDPLEDFVVDVACCMGSWIGMIRQVRCRVVLAFQDGSLCELADSDAELLEDVMDKRDPSSEFLRYNFFRGEQLSGPLHVFKRAEWRHQTIEMTRMLDNPKMRNRAANVVVKEVATTSLGVQWQCQGCGSGDPRPPAIVSGEEELRRVKMLNVFEPCTLQIGDRKFYRLREEDAVESREEWRAAEKLRLSQEEEEAPAAAKDDEGDDEVAKPPKGKKPSKKRRMAAAASASGPSSSGAASFRTKGPNGRKSKLKSSRQPAMASAKPPEEMTRPPVPGDVIVVEVLSTRSEATVVWQNGDVSENIPSTNLYPILHLDGSEFFCGDFVVKAPGSSTEPDDPQAYGVVESVDHFARTCWVNWFRTYSYGQEPSPRTLDRTEEPVFDLKEHPDFSYRSGSIVVRVTRGNNEEASVGGQVLDVLVTGKVLVWWADGSKASCWPQDVYKIGEYDSDDGELWQDGAYEDDDYHGEGGEDSWETESEHSLPGAASQEDGLAGLRPYLASAIDKAQKALLGMEGAFGGGGNGDPTVKRLLDVHAECLNLDSLMGTAFFQADSLQGLVEDVKKLNRHGSHQRALNSQVSRLFSSGSEAAGQDARPHGEGCQDKEQAEDGNKTCANLCSTMRTQLLECQAEVAKRLGSGTNYVVTFKQEPLVAVEAKEEDESVPEHLKRCVSGTNYVITVAQKPIVAEEEEEAKDQEEEKGSEQSDRNSNCVEAAESGTFTTLESAPNQHTFKHSTFRPTNPKNVVKFVRREVQLMRDSLPPGIHVKGFEDRMDLYSAMIEGPANTPYEDGMFFFDFQLSQDYPCSPPTFHYHSYTSDRLNPNLYVDGKVCVSLLGTWSGKGSETWNVGSNLLQVLVSIQGLILVGEPYYNEAGYERQKGTQQGGENSRMYNEMVLLKMVQGMERLLGNPPEAFKEEVEAQLGRRADNIFQRLEQWRKVNDAKPPDYPLLPASRGFWISVDRAVESLKKALQGRG